MTTISYQSSTSTSNNQTSSPTMLGARTNSKLNNNDNNNQASINLNNNNNLTNNNNNNNKSLETRRSSEISNKTTISSTSSSRSNASSISSITDNSECNCGNKHLLEFPASSSSTMNIEPSSFSSSLPSNAKEVDSQQPEEDVVMSTEDQITIKEETRSNSESIKVVDKEMKLEEPLNLSSNTNTNGLSRIKSNDFDRFSLPTAAQLLAASECKVVGESGVSIQFSQLIHQRGRVVVVFLRHLWCGLCQQYVTALQSLSSSLPPSSFTSTSTTSSNQITTSQIPPLYILLISSGSPSLIPIYRKRLNCPFPLYVDQSRTLYKILGMTRKSWDAGSSSSSSTSTSNFNSSIPSSPTHLDSLQHSSWPGNTSTSLAVSGVGSGRESGGSGGGGGDRTISSYANGGLIKNIRESIGSALVMSLKSAGGIGGINPGSQRQLGGEFVLESCDGEERIECTYASRMSNTRNHSEVRELFAAAGVELRALPSEEDQDVNF